MPPALARTSRGRYPPAARRFHAYLMAGRREAERGFGAVHSNHGRGWRLDVRPYGWIYGLLGQGFESRADAEALLRKIRARIDAGLSHEAAVAPFLPISRRAAKVTTHYDAWVERRRREAALGQLSYNTVALYAKYARPGRELAFWDACSIYDVDAASLDDWRLWLAERGLAPKTIWNVLGAFRTFLKSLVRRGELEGVPIFPTVALEYREARVLTVAQQSRVLAALQGPARGAHLIAATMGLRPSEVRALVRADYSPARGTALGRLHVERARQGRAHDAPLGPTKNRRARTLPVPDVVSAWIEEHVTPAERLRDPEAPLVPNPRTGLAWSHDAFADAWRRACEDAGVPPIAVYNGTKHTAATAMLERSGGNLEAVARMLGHADTRSTRRYAQITDGTLIELARGKTGRKR